MRRALVAVAALGVLVVLVAALLDDRERAFTVGLPPVRIAAELQPGERVCRTDIDVPAEFARVRLFAASFGRPGPRLGVTAGDSRGTVVAGYPDNSAVEANMEAVPEGERIDICVTNEGDSRVALRGSPPDTPPPYLGDPELEPELGVAFLRDEPSVDGRARAGGFRARLPLPAPPGLAHGRSGSCSSWWQPACRRC